MTYLAATDWNEITGISTAALAVLTFALVLAAIVAARYAKHDIDTQRPIPNNLDSGSNVLRSWRARGPFDWRRVHVGYEAWHIYVAVPLRNVGPGLAVVDPEMTRVAGDGISRHLGCEAHRERVPPGEATRVLCTAGGQATFADIRLEHVHDDRWLVRSVRPVAPENVALPAAG